MNEHTPHSMETEPGFSLPEIEFIQAHLRENVSDLMLRGKPTKGLDIKKLAEQIQSRQKALKKLPEWSANHKLVFPAALSVEQSSSEATARYKAKLLSGDQLIDITGGMGVDCYYMQENFQDVHYFEQQPAVAEAAKYNFAQLGVNNITVHAVDSIETLKAESFSADWIYADPARRNANHEKVVLLGDCTPDIVEHLPILFERAPNVLLKTSPLLDIDLAAKSLRNLKEVHVIGYEGECKELLFVLKKDWIADIFDIKVRIINSAGEVLNMLDLTRETEQLAQVQYTKPLKYLYEPHAAVLKAGAFRTICSTYSLSKLAINTQLYTSDDLINEFPGRVFEVVAVCKPAMREVKKVIEGDKANLTVRNFPASVEDLRKKLKLKDGGKFYLFATSLPHSARVMIVTVKPSR
ncbi:class I SAM-dependent methyltransferase [Dyadobacter sp. LJ53]|uniref:class I SAM-dependent methyltransferase n=1 Tax=Dyadobacter chenwenxiniae TaxID=2906456 RepID=UPI001F1F17B7|nr:class I SAM-dependent methyltransferase [Dyadobacter chenwenxiniae]MCF0053372.1 class I SAM-dependent methyltransferase [Dyadobacter chenwenxiniae]